MQKLGKVCCSFEKTLYTNVVSEGFIQFLSIKALFFYFFLYNICRSNCICIAHTACPPFGSDRLIWGHQRWCDATGSAGNSLWTKTGETHNFFFYSMWLGHKLQTLFILRECWIRLLHNHMPSGHYIPQNDFITVEMSHFGVFVYIANIILRWVTDSMQWM